MYYNEARQSKLCPRPTGLPSHVALLNKMDALKATMSNSVNKLEGTLKDELNRRGIGGKCFKQMVSFKMYEMFTRK